MAQYFKHVPARSFIKVDYKIVNHESLSDAAQLFYVKLCKLPQGKLLTNPELCKLFGLGEKKLLACKKELSEYGYLCTKQLTKEIYMCFLGTSTIRAEEVADEYFRKKKQNETQPEPKTYLETRLYSVEDCGIGLTISEATDPYRDTDKS